MPDISLKKQDYKYGFITPIASEAIDKGIE